MNKWKSIIVSLVFVALVIPLGRTQELAKLIESNCFSCHDANTKSGQLDLTALKSVDAKSYDLWVKVYDRVVSNEMPPKKADPINDIDKKALLKSVGDQLTAIDVNQSQSEGRSTRRRMNRGEYENTLRDLFGTPWLSVKSMLPEDAVAHGYNTVGDALDVSHVQMARYLVAAEHALNSVAIVPPPSKTKRYYAREQNSFIRRMTYSQFNTAPERATFPVLDYSGQPDVRASKAKMTVGANEPKTRELEGVGLVQGAYEPVEPKFDQFKAPASGRYRLRFNALSVWVGPNGGNYNLKNPEQINRKWFIPDLDVVSKGRRNEPVTIFSEQPPRQLRRLGAFDVTSEAGIHELDVELQAGETIRPDASRFFRSRPGEQRWQNPLAEADGQPGVVYRWMEVEGPIASPNAEKGRALLFGDLKNETSDRPAEDAKRLLSRFAEAAYRRPVPESEKIRFWPVIEARLKSGASFKTALFAGYMAVLCSPEFLMIHSEPGTLNDDALASRLSYFLINSQPDAELKSFGATGQKSDLLRGESKAGHLTDPKSLRSQTERLLNDPKSDRFRQSFLDYWLDLRKINDNSPDSGLYGEYYLDDWLTDSSLDETRSYFAELIKANRPAREIVASDWTFVNEKLAMHYGFPKVDGTNVRKVSLPKNSIRGGLITQASILTVTANGTTTSPVVRGAWITDRILGKTPPKPPPVPAVEPDLRGTTTIREQLAKHRDQASCAACHAKIDPPGFALESFDIVGGFRKTYRAQAEKKDRVKGFAKSGQPLEYHEGLPVDSSGELTDGQAFKDIVEFKQLLLKDERQIARNFVNQLTIYATGSPIRFADRAIVETILDQTKTDGYRIRDLILELVQSDLFRKK